MKYQNFRIFLLFWVLGFSTQILADSQSCLQEHSERNAFFDRHITFLKRHGEGRSFYFMYKGFSNNFIENCCIQIENQCSLEPLQKLWIDHKNELFVDEVAVRELSILVFMVYENLIVASKKSAFASRDLPWFSLITLYFKLSAIPLAKLFDIIDECLERYKEIFEDYSTSSPRQTFASWIIENWWIPSMVGAMVVVSFARWYRDHKTYKRSVDAAIFLT